MSEGRCATDRLFSCISRLRETGERGVGCKGKVCVDRCSGVTYFNPDSQGQCTAIRHVSGVRSLSLSLSLVWGGFSLFNND